jgi:hypothetical protein
MTITIPIRPEVEAELARQAAAHGSAVEAYAAALLEEAVHTPAPSDAGTNVSSIRPQDERREAVKRLLEFGEKYRLSLGEPITRQLLHEGHRY